VSDNLAKAFKKQPVDFLNKRINEPNTHKCSTKSFVDFLAKTNQLGSLFDIIEMPYKAKQDEKFFVASIKLSESQRVELLKALKIKAPYLPDFITITYFSIAVPLDIKKHLLKHPQLKKRIVNQISILLLLVALLISANIETISHEIKTILQKTEIK
jgi:hypothetical protein